jgi:hypothetical protein
MFGNASNMFNISLDLKPYLKYFELIIIINNTIL